MTDYRDPAQQGERGRIIRPHVQPESSRRSRRAVRRGHLRPAQPEVGDGKQEFIDYFLRMADVYPGKWVEFKRVIGEDNTWFCITTSSGLVTTSTPASTHRDGNLVEQWDVLQTIPQRSANDHAMF